MEAFVIKPGGLTRTLLILCCPQSRAERVQQSPNFAVFSANIVPCDVAEEEPPFQLRVHVSRAHEALAAQAYYGALFRKRIGGGSAEENSQLDVDGWAEEDEELRELRQRLIDAREGGGATGVEEGGNEVASLGYYIEVLLVAPHMELEEAVVAPPLDLDKTNPAAKRMKPEGRSGSMASINEEVLKNVMAVGDNDDDGGAVVVSSVFQGDVYTSSQFMSPGTQEKASLDAFKNLCLDVRKALTRLEFPIFPKGCRDRTFKEVYQLNARVSRAISSVVVAAALYPRACVLRNVRMKENSWVNALDGYTARYSSSLPIADGTAQLEWRDRDICRFLGDDPGGFDKYLMILLECHQLAVGTYHLLGEI